MSLEAILNIYMLFAAGIGLFFSLYRYVEAPKRIWTYSTLFFLAHFLSDYYWTIYVLVMNDDPNTSALLAYFGWDLAYVFLLLLLLRLRTEEEKNFFSWGMLLPIPLNIAQFILYLPYGGIFNNIWQGICCTMIACMSLRSILYYLKNKKNGVTFPYFQLIAFLIVVGEYGMWTSSCFTFENQFLDPYHYFSFLGYTVTLMVPWTLWKSLAQGDAEDEGKNVIGPRFHMVFQVVVALIICGCSMGGYIVAMKMRDGVGYGMEAASDRSSGTIVVVLFFLSVLLDIIVLALMLGVYVYFRHRKKKVVIERESKGKFNFWFTMSITFILMVFAVIYTSQLLYRESVTGLYRECEDKVAKITTSLSNYLSMAEAILWVTGDSVDQMRKNGIEMEKIHDYIRVETANQAEKFDENFTGIYGVIEGVYLDGLDWVPPEGYDPLQRGWYTCAVEAGEDVTIVPPYVDAQTGAVIISISKLLSDKRSVLSLDVTLNHVQDIVSQININGNGYGLIIDQDGMIISHADKKMNGSYCQDLFAGDAFLNTVLKVRSGRTHMKIEGEDYTLFCNEVYDKWYSVALVKTEELMAEVHLKLGVNICVYIIIFFLITFFYYMSYMNEQKAGKVMEELITERQKQEYESRVLKLEKSAADKANEAKSRFLADMSHEIRTPINAVLGMNEMILRETDSESIREYAENIRSSGRALLNLINSILDFSKIEDGKMEIIPVEYKTVEMIHYLQASVMERAAAKSLSFLVEVDPTIPTLLYGDDMRLSQVIMNLLTNAVKYTKEGEVRFSVKNKGLAGDTVKLMVQVKDTGIGIRKEDMPKLFESFERLDKEKNRNIEGTGLGMAIVTRLLAMMGSELSVESEYGVGSTFSFVIEQKVVDSKEIGDSFDRLSEGAKNEWKGKNYHEEFHAPEACILIVDDTKMNLKVVKNLLKKTQMDIDTVLSGEEALALCDQKRYDVILMDQRMPGMDGTQTLQHIREKKEGINAKTPVICLTADAISGARDRYIAEGFSDYLTKPVDGHELERMLLVYLPAEKVRRSEEAREENGKTSFWEKYDKLKECGIDVKTALLYCQRDEGIFESVLGEYVADEHEKQRKLRECFATKDWENYSIYIHALKSTSKLIGALALSEMAARLENAARKNDEKAIEASQEEMLQKHRHTVECIREILGLREQGEGNDSKIDDAPLEFLPDGEQ